MSLYLNVMNGLRGCYMPDNACVMRFETRKELKSFLKDECANMREAYGHGAPAKEIAATAAWCWKRRKVGWSYDMVIGFGRSRSTDDRPFGLMLGYAKRRDYLDYLKESEQW